VLAQIFLLFCFLNKIKNAPAAQKHIDQKIPGAGYFYKAVPGAKEKSLEENK